MKTNSIGFIGAGRITRILLQAYLNKRVEFKSVLVYDTNPEVLSGLKELFPDISLVDNLHTIAGQDIVFIALHPPAIMETLDKINGHTKMDTVLISLAPKITIDKIAEKTGMKNIVRLIPNATSYINEGINPYCFSDNFDGDKKMITGLFDPPGKSLEVAENKLEVYAIVSAMLPTYFWFQWKAIEELGVELGMDKEESASAIYETILAALNLLYKSGLPPEQVIDLIPVKPIGEHEEEIRNIYRNKLTGLHGKIRP